MWKTAFKKFERDPFKFFKGCHPQVLLGPFSNTLSHISLELPEKKEKPKPPEHDGQDIPNVQDPNRWWHNLKARNTSDRKSMQNDWNWKKEKMWDKEIFIKYKAKHYYQNILKNSKFKHQYLYEPYTYFKLHLF